MSELRRTAAEAARAIADALSAEGLPYAIGGALALGVFFRLKDRSDLERPVAVRGARLDHAYVRRWIVEMMGEDDERVRAWDDIVARLGPSREGGNGREAEKPRE